VVVAAWAETKQGGSRKNNKKNIKDRSNNNKVPGKDKARKWWSRNQDQGYAQKQPTADTGSRGIWRRTYALLHAEYSAGDRSRTP
jgi:hypothetical protein